MVQVFLFFLWSLERTGYFNCVLLALQCQNMYPGTMQSTVLHAIHGRCACVLSTTMSTALSTALSTEGNILHGSQQM